MARRDSGVFVEAKIDRVQWARLQRDMRRMAPETKKQLNKELKDLLRQDIVPSAKGHASWSSRIPGAIKPQVTVKKVGLRVRAKNAPHARPYEGISQGATFRHPVFGNRNVWVTQAARPFLDPAVEEHKEEFMEAAGTAVDEAADKTGWK